jgi:hypothetical protein
MKRFSSLLFSLLISSLFSFAQVEKGGLAPDFSLRDEQGNTWSSKDFYGKKGGGGLFLSCRNDWGMHQASL